MVETDTQLIEQIQSNFISYFRLFAGLPGVTFVEEDVTWFCNTRGGEPGNFVLRTKFAADAADHDIDRLLAQIGKLTSHMDWMVFPTCRPADLGRRLDARGMAGHRAGTWMTADLTQLSDAPAVPPGFTIQWVQDDAALWVWKLAQDAGFGGDEQIYYDAYAKHGYGAEAVARHYVGFQDDRPVTSGTLLLSDGIASIYNVATPPARRRRGYGSAITAHMMGEAIRCGYRLAWIWASDAGKSVYARLGFVEEDFGIREHTWQRDRKCRRGQLGIDLAPIRSQVVETAADDGRLVGADAIQLKGLAVRQDIPGRAEPICIHIDCVTGKFVDANIWFDSLEYKQRPDLSAAEQFKNVTGHVN